MGTASKKQNDFDWCKFYFALWEDDPIVQAMSTLEEGAYFRLWRKCWKQKPVATLPDDDVQLSHFAKLQIDDWKSIKPKVMAAFKWNKATKRWVQKRLRQVYFEIKQSNKATHDRAVAGGRGKARAQALLKQSQSNASCLPIREVEKREVENKRIARAHSAKNETPEDIARRIVGAA